MKLFPASIISWILICITLPNVFSSDNASADFDTLTLLLKDLREIRQTKVTLRNQWKEEKEQLELIKKIEEEKLDILQEAKKNAASTMAKLKTSLDDTSKQNQIVNESEGQLRDWIDKICQGLIEEASVYPILLNDESKKRIQNVLKEDHTTTDKLVLYLNFMLDTAVAGTKVKVQRRTVDVEGKPLSADVLTMGGALEYFITPDNKLCGYKEHEGGRNVAWKKLDKTFAEPLRTTIRVVNREIPPKLVTLPVPASAIKSKLK